MTKIRKSMTHAPASLEATVIANLERRSIVLIGMRGVGKTSIGRRLASRLELPFVEAGTEIEKAAGMALADIVKAHGEAQLRAGEQRIIARLFAGGPQVLTISDDAFIIPEVRAEILRYHVSVWLRAPNAMWMRSGLQRRQPEAAQAVQTEADEALPKVIVERETVLAQADITIEVEGSKPEFLVDEILHRITALRDLDRTKDRSNWTFAQLLGWHLTRGTRPTVDESLKRPWSLEEFVSHSGHSDRTIQRWIIGAGLPSDIGAVERALFGDNPRYGEYREELRESHNRALDTRGNRRAVRLNGDLIRNFREQKPITASKMSAEIGIDVRTLRRAERKYFVSTYVAERISEFMAVDPTLLLYEDQQVIPPPAEAIPSAEPKAIRFTGGPSGVIDLTPLTELGEHLEQGAGQKDDYGELRVKASELNSLGSNRLGRIAQPIARFLSLPDDIVQVRAKLFWSRVNTLRILWQDHQDASSSRAFGGEADERLLEPTAASQLKDLVETINVFVVGDPNLMELDAIRPGPQDIDAAKVEAAVLAPVVEDVISRSDIASEGAQDAISEQLKNVDMSGDHLATRQANEFARRSLRNFVGELLRRAYSPVRALSRATKAETTVAWKGIREGAYRAAGAAVLTGTATDIAGLTNFSDAIVRFVIRHAEALSAYVITAFQNPTLVEIINWIVRFGG